MPALSYLLLPHIALPHRDAATERGFIYLLPIFFFGQPDIILKTEAASLLISSLRDFSGKFFNGGTKWDRTQSVFNLTPALFAKDGD